MWRSRHRLFHVYLAIGASLPLAGLLVLHPIRNTPGFGTQLRLNIGANLLDLVVAVLILQPLIISLNRNAVRWRSLLDYREVIRLIAGVRIIAAGPAHAFYRVDD